MSPDREDFELRVEQRQGYVFFWQKGAVKDLAELERVCAEMSAALRVAGTRYAMFDNRETERPDPLVRAAMWTWLSDNVDRAALIQGVPANVSRADRVAERNRLSSRAFQDEAEAEAWLLLTAPAAD